MVFNDTRIDIEKMDSLGCPFLFIWGGRGHGKTYPTLRYMIQEHKSFIFLKRTEEDIKLLLSGKDDTDVSPFLALNKDYGWNIHPYRFGKSFAGFWESVVDDDGTFHRTGEMLGYVFSLSTVNKIKGFSIDVDYIIFDEFIPQIGERRQPADGLWNLYETVNRNRELLGRKPVGLICLANSTMLYNPVFESARLVSTVEKMSKERKEYKIIKDRGIILHRLPDQDGFTEKKRQTALYRMMDGTAFARMALENDFAYEDFGLIEYRKLNGYSPVCNLIHDHISIGIWQHKKAGDVYVSYNVGKFVPTHDLMQEQERIKARLFLQRFRPKWLNNDVHFESYELKHIYMELTT